MPRCNPHSIGLRTHFAFIFRKDKSQLRHKPRFEVRWPGTSNGGSDVGVRPFRKRLTTFKNWLTFELKKVDKDRCASELEGWKLFFHENRIKIFPLVARHRNNFRGNCPKSTAAMSTPSEQFGNGILKRIFFQSKQYLFFPTERKLKFSCREVWEQCAQSPQCARPIFPTERKFKFSWNAIFVEAHLFSD